MVNEERRRSSVEICTIQLEGLKFLQSRIHSNSQPDLAGLIQENQKQNPPDSLCPEDNLMQMLKVHHNLEVQLQNSLDLKSFFSEYTDEEIAAYDSEILNAVRSQDLERLREFHRKGRPLKCSNSFGESILHLACRRNLIEVVRFLIHEAQVAVRIRDDYGRTILHDAAWTCEPNFELIELILRECADLLYMRDRRGHTPLSYARKSHWRDWNNFLTSRAEGDLFIPDNFWFQSWSK